MTPAIGAARRGLNTRRSLRAVQSRIERVDPLARVGQLGVVLSHVHCASVFGEEVQRAGQLLRGSIQRTVYRSGALSRVHVHDFAGVFNLKLSNVGI